MRTVYEAVCAQPPGWIALRGSAGEVSYGALRAAVEHAIENLRETAPRVIGLALDNGPLWAMMDLAAMQARIPLVPLPFFFSAGQIAHAIRDAGMDCIHTDQPRQFEQLLASMGIGVRERSEFLIHGQPVTEFRLSGIAPVELPPATAKITYTSGTTGNPKGVCLDSDAMLSVAHSLLDATGMSPQDNHVALMPLSTLLENIAGLHVPLLAGACVTLLPFEETGLRGASGVDVNKMAATLAAHEATTTILTPELLRGLVATAQAGALVSSRLRFVAVGGAPVAQGLLAQAAQLGIPVYEGYGLSECASVVAVNTEDAHRRGSVGRPLSHARLGFAEDGEILAAGALMLGYTGNTPCAFHNGYWPTGDLGFLDADGFLHITGRKKNIFITSFGRNVAPEWVERELALHPAIAQVAVFGEARPWNAAVIVPSSQMPEIFASIDAAIEQANQRLPDYARIRRWIPADTPFLSANGQLTPNGRLRRDVIFDVYRAQLEHLYEEDQYAVL
ncbi:MAG: AMP-binding protein [Methylobacillus sp.]|jgi:long-subunit acyl-CoA synthetase (AMP-forming)|nr:AMP-binding protein [Methylobacillus sp.]